MVVVLLGVLLQNCWMYCRSIAGCALAVFLCVWLQYYWMCDCSITGCIITALLLSVLLQYYWLLSILLLAQIVLIVFVFIFYFMEDVAQTLKLYPEDLLRDAIKKYREDVDMRNFIDDMQDFVSIR